MSMSRAELRRIEAKYGKDSRVAYFARQQLAAEHAGSAYEVYVTGSVKRLPEKVKRPKR